MRQLPIAASLVILRREQRFARLFAGAALGRDVHRFGGEVVGDAEGHEGGDGGQGGRDEEGDVVGGDVWLHSAAGGEMRRADGGQRRAKDGDADRATDAALYAGERRGVTGIGA